MRMQTRMTNSALRVPRLATEAPLTLFLVCGYVVAVRFEAGVEGARVILHDPEATVSAPTPSVSMACLDPVAYGW